jgi:Fibronectin type III domain
MRRQNSEEFRSRYVPRLHAIGLMLGGILVVASSGHAGVLTASWTAPTTNTDGSALTDLALYRVYYDTSDSPCRGSTFFEVASPTPTPQPSQTLSFQLTGLTTASIYNVSVTAVNTGGDESFCSDIASAIARDDSTATTPVQDPTVPVPDTTTPQDTTTPTVPDGSATTPNGFCPPGQAKKGLC